MYKKYLVLGIVVISALAYFMWLMPSGYAPNPFCSCPEIYHYTCNQEEITNTGFDDTCGCVLNDDFSCGEGKCYKFDWTEIPPEYNTLLAEMPQDKCILSGGFWFPPPPCMPKPFLTCDEVM